MAIWYVQQTATATDDGTSRTNAWGLASVDWTGSGVQPGDTLVFIGIFTSAILAGGSGASLAVPITLLGDDGCTVNASLGFECLSITNKNFITVDGEWALNDGASHCLLIDGTSTGTVVNDVVGDGSGNQAFQLDTTGIAYFNNITGKNCVDDGFSVHAGTGIIDGGTFTGNDEGIAMATAGVGTLYGRNISVSGNTTSNLLTNGANHKMYIEGLTSTDAQILPTVGLISLSNFDVTAPAGAHAIDANTGALELKGGVLHGMSATKYGVVFRGTTGVCENIVCIGASQVGKGVSVNAATNLAIINSIFTDMEVGINDSTTGTVTTTNCCFDPNNAADTVGTVTETGSVNSDPLLNADYTLQSGSPCIGAGIGNSWDSGNPTGLGGEPIADMNTDIGAVQGTDATNHPFHPVNL